MWPLAPCCPLPECSEQEANARSQDRLEAKSLRSVRLRAHKQSGDLHRSPAFQDHPINSAYLAIAALAASIFSFTASRLKLAPFCIGGNSIAVWANFSTWSWTNTKRQNSYLNQSKYACDPDLVPSSGQPVRSKGSSRRLIRKGTSTWVLAPSQPLG